MTAEEYITNLDKQYGESWSNDSDLLVKALEDFAKLSYNSDYAKCPKCGDGLQISCTNAGCDYIEKFEKHFT